MHPTLDPRMPFFMPEPIPGRQSESSRPSQVVFSAGKEIPLTAQHLSLAAPDALQQAVPLRQAVHRVVALAHRSHEAAQGVDVVLAGNGAAVLVDLGDRNLDGAVVLGLDDAVGGAALARDVAAETEVISISVAELRVSGGPYRSTISPRSFSILTVEEG